MLSFLRISSATWRSELVAFVLNMFLVGPRLGIRPCGCGQRSESQEGRAVSGRADLKSSAYCVDCNIDTAAAGEIYLVHDHVWQQTGLHPLGGSLCVICLERRLRRTLTPNDFQHCAINYGDSDEGRIPQSVPLLRRLGRYRHPPPKRRR